ncbi:unnamed protein product [Ilex paraguariensis]|uniref:Uncharacterized protein n=2 Tax=Ilex paraguariensis TaxID=185542 RepID=A0ABC8SUI5_9AQUA
MVRVVVNVGIFGSPELDSREKGRRQIVRAITEIPRREDFGDEFGRQRMRLRRILREILGEDMGESEETGASEEEISHQAVTFFTKLYKSKNHTLDEELFGVIPELVGPTDNENLTMAATLIEVK